MASHVLDNVVWHALTGPQTHLGKRSGMAVSFDHEVNVFAGICDPTSPQGWSDLADLMGSHAAVLFAPDIVLPGDWSQVAVMPCLQMVATDVAIEPQAMLLDELGPDDVPDMLALVEATRPGPMSKRTIEMGRYVGLREDGMLIAMAGERMKVPGYTEISAVCTADEARGRGLGRVVVNEVLRAIRDRGEEGFLHVLTDNAPAIALYEAMGFTVRTQADAVICQRRTAQDA